MRYGLFSDVHSNLEAFQTVLSALNKEKVDAYVFLGDIVGYGADPRGCIKLLRELIRDTGCMCIAGNHDYATCGLCGTKDFNIYAKEAIAWTRGQLDTRDMEFLSQLKLVESVGRDRLSKNCSKGGQSKGNASEIDEELPVDEFTIVHSTLTDPIKWGYIFDIDDAYPNFKILKTKVCFVGHSHRPVIFTLGNMVDWFMAQKIFLQDNVRYIVNIGSVGQPRDGNPKSSYAIYDTERVSLEIKRAAYDVKKAQEKIIQAGLPEILAERLSVGR